MKNIQGTIGLNHTHINQQGKIVFCLGSNGGPFDRKSDGTYDRSMPLTSLPILRPGIDIAIVPAGELEAATATFYQEMLGLEPWQIQFAPGSFCALESSVCGNMQAELRSMAGADSTLLTYNQHEAAEWLSHRIATPLYGDSWRWRVEFGKMSLHRHINPAKQQSLSLTDIDGIRAPRGYVADTTEELIQAFDALTSDSIRFLVLKPAFSDAGEGIQYVSARNSKKLCEYPFTLGPVILEERITFASHQNIPISPSIHWAGSAVGVPTNQVVENGEYQGTCYPAVLPPSIASQASSMVRTYVDYAKPEGLGGLDFIGGQDGNLYLCDVNNGRCTEAIPPLLFASLYGGEKGVLLAQKWIPKGSVRALWDRLLCKGIAWFPGRDEADVSGVFPLMHLDGVTGMLVARAPTVPEAQSLLRTAIHPL